MRWSLRQRFCSCRRRRCLSFLLASLGPGFALGEKGENNQRGRTVKAVMQTLGFALIGSLGPGSAVGEKGKKRRQIRNHSTVYLEGVSHVPGKLTFWKKIVNWHCDKLNWASVYYFAGWTRGWNLNEHVIFSPCCINWMNGSRVNEQHYKWKGLNLVVLETLVLKAPWRKSSLSFSFSIMTFLRMLNKTLLWLSLSASKEYYRKISSNE